MFNEGNSQDNRSFKFDFRRGYLPFLLMLLIVITAIFTLHFEGRIWWCKWDTPALVWSGDAWGKHNSQHFFDPYSFTHVLHGLCFYGLLYSIFRRRLSFPRLLLIAVIFESAWEVLENSSAVVEHYRAATVSFQYFGDSIANSFGDILSCSLGFFIAHKLAFWRSLALFALTEIVLIFWIHDSLLINIIMLIHPIEWIKAWQTGG